MHAQTQPCLRILAYRPPRIAMALLAGATALHLAIGAWTPLLPSTVPGAGAAATLGFLIMLRAWWLFGRVETAICPTAHTTTLITDDVYGYTRNPMYLGIVLMLLGAALFTGSAFHYAAALMFFAAIDHSFCPYEEQKLRREFPGDYDDYAKRVRRWL